MVKKGRTRGKQGYLCRSCGRQFLEGAINRYNKSVRERGLRMYMNGMSMISRVLQVPLETVLMWIKVTRGT